jgi:hypothetical protein
MKTLILTFALALSFTTFSQEALDDDLRITAEKFMRKGEWSHEQEYGWNSYDCNRRFFYRCYDKAEMDSLIIQVLEEYSIDATDIGQRMINDRGDSCHMWEATENGWEITIHTYKNEWDRWMIYIRLD